MKWEKVKLGDCCASISDGDHQPPPKVKSGIPFVTISNISSSNQFDFCDTMFVPQKYYDKLDTKRKAQKNDILYSVVGSFGIPVLIKDNKPFVFQRHIAILRPDSRVVFPKFLYYVMLSKEFYALADTVAVGAAQRTISLSALRNIEISLPDIEKQKRIASILSAYDDLIENNQRQIKLLEEAAQRLYKEWFVDLRFPGYEHTPIVDGVPEGWERKAVTDLLMIKYGKDHKELSNGTIPAYGSGGLMRKVSSSIYSGESILIPRKGSLNNVMYVSGIFWTIDTMFYSIPQFSNIIKYTYIFLSGLDMYSFNIGAAVPSMTVKILDGIHLFLPPKELLSSFEKEVSPFFDCKRKLEKQIDLARQARDRLLPKLMSGEWEV